MAMRTHKTYVIIDIETNRVLHVTNDRNESMKIYDEYKKNEKTGGRKVTADCYNH